MRRMISTCWFGPGGSIRQLHQDEKNIAKPGDFLMVFSAEYKTKDRQLRGKPVFLENVEFFGYNFCFWLLNNFFIQKLPL